MDGSWLQQLRGGEGIREIGEEEGTERSGEREKGGEKEDPAVTPLPCPAPPSL
jgi:hypothetical protein